VTPDGVEQTDTLGKDRSPAAVLGLSFITLRIYYLVWYHHINAEIRLHDPGIKVTPGWCVVAAHRPHCEHRQCLFHRGSDSTDAAGRWATDTISPVVALLLHVFLGIGYPLYVTSQLREHWHGHRRALRAAAP
jgi:hypothetical protein